MGRMRYAGLTGVRTGAMPAVELNVGNQSIFLIFFLIFDF
jgi:hypothetical protein